MRIISGGAGGIRLQVPPGDAVRPTTDRVKESVFASLEPLAGLRVVDLFSGSGALGLEALSRGAAAVVLVEHDRRALACLRDNTERVRKAIGSGCGSLRIAPMSVANAPRLLPEWAMTADLIFADPPYHPGPGAYGGAALLQDVAFGQWAGRARLVLEHAAASALPWYPEGPWRPTVRKRYGSLSVTVARLVSPNDDGLAASAGTLVNGLDKTSVTVYPTGHEWN
jgi:16S rRNA (guanine966-N2)-methyltransferase